MTIVKFSLICLLSCLGCNSSLASSQKPKNIIMVIADGMGTTYPIAYRFYKNKTNNNQITNTVFDQHLIGTVTTTPDQSSNFITDSAAAATALSAGVKTYNGAIGVDINKKPVETVLEYAKKIGKNTGVIVTSSLTHATPAAYLSHVSSRHLHKNIADSFFDERIDGQFKIDLMLGGGTKYFKRNDRDLTQEFIEQGFQYITNYQALRHLKQQPVVGLFAPEGLPSHIDDNTKNRLTLMTDSAINHLENTLSNKKGFFLLIEASQIDWAGHNNDIAVAMSDMAELENTMEFLVDYVKKSPDTLVILTSDHNTGGLSIGANKAYVWHPKILHNIKHSPEYIAKHIAYNELNPDYLTSQLGFKLSIQELAMLADSKNSSFNNGNDEIFENSSLAKVQITTGLTKAIRKIINKRTNTRWTTIGHTGEDVSLYAFGSNHKDFIGYHDNTDIAHKIFKLLGKQSD